MGGKDRMFRYADGKDKLLMFFGLIGSIGDGMQYPLMMFVLSYVINDYGKPNSSLSNDTVDKVRVCSPDCNFVPWAQLCIIATFQS